jgi:hypothetical protein
MSIWADEEPVTLQDKIDALVAELDIMIEDAE